MPFSTTTPIPKPSAAILRRSTISGLSLFTFSNSPISFTIGTSVLAAKSPSLGSYGLNVSCSATAAAAPILADLPFATDTALFPNCEFSKLVVPLVRVLDIDAQLPTILATPPPSFNIRKAGIIPIPN